MYEMRRFFFRIYSATKPSLVRLLYNLVKQPLNLLNEAMYAYLAKPGLGQGHEVTEKRQISIKQYIGGQVFSILSIRHISSRPNLIIP